MGQAYGRLPRPYAAANAHAIASDYDPSKLLGGCSFWAAGQAQTPSAPGPLDRIAKRTTSISRRRIFQRGRGAGTAGYAGSPLVGATELERKEYAEAQKALEPAVTLNGGPETRHHLLADCYLRRNDYKHARQQVVSAI